MIRTAAIPVSHGEAGQALHTQGGVLLHVYEELAQHRGQMEITRDLLNRG